MSRVRLLGILLLLSSLAPAPAARAQDVVGGLLIVARWVPNRLLDALDLVRLRARVGPGAAVAVRAGPRLGWFRGRYVSVFAGLPGPRGRRWPRLPVGLESRAANSPDDATGALPGTDPGYGRAEGALGFQAAVLGLEVGIDPLEIIDFAFGLVTLDPAGDDW